MELEPVTTGHKLWKSLIKRTGLNLKLYDSQVETELRKILDFSEDQPTSDLLKSNNTSPEALLAAFFRTLKPYTRMFSDILKLVEDSGHKCGEDNIKIKFDFDTDESIPDLENFRQQYRTFQTITRPVRIETWNYSLIWKLHHIFAEKDRLILRTDGLHPDDNVHPDIDYWIKDYRNEHWTDPDVRTPVTGNFRLDGLLRHIWQLRSAMVEKARNYDKVIPRLFSLKGQAAGEITLSDGRITFPENNREVLRFISSVFQDRWALTLTKNAYRRAMEAQTDIAIKTSLLKK